MIEAVSKERWLEAQAAEAEVVQYDMKGAYASTRLVFDYLNLGFNQQNKTITEVGCGPFPAVMFCAVSLVEAKH